MSLKITHKYSTAAGTPPASGDIDVGELAINAADVVLYAKDTNGNIKEFKSQFIQSGTGASTRTVESKLKEIVSVRDFGAIGDGVTDDTAAIQAALVYAASLASTGGCAVEFTAGVYKVSASLNLYTNTDIIGKGAAKITRSADYGSTLVLDNVFNCKVENIYFENTGAMSSGAHVSCLNGGNYVWLDRCLMRNGFRGVYLEGTGAFKLTTCIIDYTQSFGAGSAGLFVKQNASFLKPVCTVTDTNIVVGVPSGGAITPYVDFGVVAEEVDGLKMTGCYVMGSGVANFKLGSSAPNGYASNIDITNTMSDHCKSDAIVFTGTNLVSSFRWNGGKISGLNLGDADKKGIHIQSPVFNVGITAELEGFKGSFIEIDNANAQYINICDCLLTKGTSLSYNKPLINILEGSQIFISNSSLNGQEKADWGIVVDAGVSKVFVTDSTFYNHTQGGVLLQSGSSLVAITGCTFDSADQAITNSGCSGFSAANPLAQGNYTVTTNTYLGYYQDAVGRVFVGGAASASEIEAGSAAGKVFKQGHECSSGTTVTYDAYHFSFANPNGFVGSIATNGSTTTYNTASDYRLKQNLTEITEASAKLARLHPVSFQWIASGSRVDGFLAHEVQAVIPEAVTGEKDAVDDSGKPIYQGIDQSKLVPLLTAALQEAIARIEKLEHALQGA